MAVSQSDIDALDSALATGERQVMIGAKQITYRSISELLAARDYMKRELALQVPAGSKQTRIRPAGRGY